MSETLAQQIFKDREILNGRPPEMSYEEYIFLRKVQTQTIKLLFKGRSPSRKLQGIMRPKQPTVRFAPKRKITQRKSG